MEEVINTNTSSSEEVISSKKRNFAILLYPEWDNFKSILSDIKGSFKNYAYIKHIPEEKEKKEHVHLLLFLENARSLEGLSKRINVPINLIQPIRSVRQACRYLIHIDDEDKYQYDLNQVIVSKSFSRNYFKAFDDRLTDDEILQNIYDFIEDMKELNPIELEIELSKFVCANCFERVFKRYYNTISKYIVYKSRKE